MSIRTRRSATTKPAPGAQINWGHPLTRSLAMVLVLDEGVGGARNLVTGAMGVLTSSSIFWSSSAYGWMVTTAANTESIGFGAFGCVTRRSDFSVFFRAAAPGSNSYVFSTAGTGSDTLRFGRISNAWSMGTPDFNYISAISMTQDRYYDVAVSHNYRVNLRFNVWDFSVPSGVSQDTVVATGVLNENTGTSGRVMNNWSNIGGDAGWQNPLVFLYTWNRQLTDVEAARLHAEPYTFLAAVAPRVQYFVPPAGLIYAPQIDQQQHSGMVGRLYV